MGLNDGKEVGSFDGKSNGKLWNLDGESVGTAEDENAGVKVGLFVLHGDSEGTVAEKSDGQLVGPFDDKSLGSFESENEKGAVVGLNEVH